jgi:hypothetical protein
VSDSSTAALNLGLQRAMEDFNKGGELDADTKRQLLNETRSGQVARGNFLGDAAAVTEATEMGKAMEDRRAARLATLLDVQNRTAQQNAALRGETASNLQNRLAAMSGAAGSASGLESSLRAENASGAQSQIGTLAALAQQLFGNQTQQMGTQAALAGQDFSQRQQAYQTQLAGLGQALFGAQSQANEDRATRTENFGRDQQNLANVSAMVLGQPITNQFGSLGSAQQGAVAYAPTAYAAGIGQNANAGNQAAQFAQGNFGTMSNIWSKQADIASQGSPWMSMLGNVAGAAAGAMI